VDEKINKASGTVLPPGAYARKENADLNGHWNEQCRLYNISIATAPSYD